MPLDLNCDLGEGEPATRARALMRHVGSVSIACGGHAGDLATMDRCLRMALALRVHAGAHPGLPGQFGRGETHIAPTELALLIVHQLGAFHRLTQLRRMPLHHVKLHGSLYHATDHSPALAEAYVESVRQWFPGLRIFARAGGRVARLARSRGVPVWEEAFADRNYLADGSLVPRTRADALITSPAKVAARIRRLRDTGELEAEDGTLLCLCPRTVCFHADSPQALALVRAAAKESWTTHP